MRGGGLWPLLCVVNADGTSRGENRKKEKFKKGIGARDGNRSVESELCVLFLLREFDAILSAAAAAVEREKKSSVVVYFRMLGAFAISAVIFIFQTRCIYFLLFYLPLVVNF